ncbi:MAG: hypothetical protein ACLRTA_04985 [Clostridia bacterium]
MKHRKKWFLVFLLAGIILMMVPFSIAYLTHVETRENRITIGQNDIMIEEDFTPPKQWQPETTYEKDVKVRIPAASPVISASTQRFPIRPSLRIWSSIRDWTQADDGYWYHNSIVEPGAVTSSLFTKVTIETSKQRAKDIQHHHLCGISYRRRYHNIRDAFAGIREGGRIA